MPLGAASELPPPWCRGGARPGLWRQQRFSRLHVMFSHVLHTSASSSYRIPLCTKRARAMASLPSKTTMLFQNEGAHTVYEGSRHCIPIIPCMRGPTVRNGPWYTVLTEPSISCCCSKHAIEVVSCTSVELVSPTARRLRLGGTRQCREADTRQRTSILVRRASWPSSWVASNAQRQGGSTFSVKQLRKRLKPQGNY